MSSIRYIKNTSWLFAQQAVRLFIAFIVSVPVARYLGAEKFGMFNYVNSVVALLSVISGLGLQNVIKRELVIRASEQREILGTSFCLSAASGICCYGIMMAIMLACSNDKVFVGLFSLLGAMLLVNPFKCVELWFQSQFRSDLSAVVTIATTGVFAAFKIYLIYCSGTLLSFGYLALAEVVVIQLVQLEAYRKAYSSIRQWSASRPRALTYLKQSWMLLISGMAIMVYMRSDQVMLGFMKSERVVGEYAVAASISSVIHLVPVTLGTAIFPAVVALRAGGHERYRRRLQQYLDISSGVSCLLAIVLTLGSKTLIARLFGTDYAAGAEVLAIHAWTLPLVFSGVARAQYLVAEKFFSFSMWCSVSGATLNVALNWILIPRNGAIGAAYATLVAQFASAFASSFIWRNTRPFGVMQLRAFDPLHASARAFEQFRRFK